VAYHQKDAINNDCFFEAVILYISKHGGGANKREGRSFSTEAPTSL